MDRRDFFFRQLVTEVEMDAAFGDAEKAFKDGAINSTIGGGAEGGALGILWGLTVQENSPQDKQVRVAIGRARNKTDGIAIVQKVVNEVVDLVTSDVVGAGNERFASVFIQPNELLSDPRVDGNSNAVNWVHAKDHKYVVDVAANEAAPASTKPVLRADAVLLCDVIRRFGDNTIANADITTTRTEFFKPHWMAKHQDGGANKHDATEIDDETAGGQHGVNVQLTLDTLSTAQVAHLDGGASKHDATEIDDETAGGSHGANVQLTLDNLNARRGPLHQTKTVKFNDASPFTLFNVEAGEIILDIWVEVTVTWDGLGTITIGDGPDPDGFAADGPMATGVLGFKLFDHTKRGVYLWNVANGTETDKIYTAVDTIDAVVVPAASTKGTMIVHMLSLKTAP